MDCPQGHIFPREGSVRKLGVAIVAITTRYCGGRREASRSPHARGLSYLGKILLRCNILASYSTPADHGLWVRQGQSINGERILCG